MFSSALKSLSSNISSNYTIASQPSSTSGPWKIYDAKRKQGGKAASVFVFDKRSLEPSSSGNSLNSRTPNSTVKRAHDEVLERLKNEASSLARLRHPSILELAEPVEETRNGGLMFATEPVTASLAALLQEKDEQESSGGVRGRGTRYVVEDADGSRRRRELEVDELEIQKGLLQLGKGLEFLHESAGLVHANLTPAAIIVNAKGDWKLSGLAFCSPHESSTAATSMAPITLHEVLNHDPRLPKQVQLDLDYSSPDFVLDNHLTASADMFSLGLIIIALYNSPHTSPINASGSLSAYKRIFSSSSTIPTQHNNFQVPSSRSLPPKLAAELLPRLITRRPAQRLSAREFQEASFFDNILVSTIRFLEALPAKTPNEKAQFMRGLPRIMPQFPKNILEKKVLPALLEEMKDKELLAPILANIFAMVKAMPNGKRTFSEKVVPRLREIFISSKPNEKDSSRDAGLIVLLENMESVAENCNGKEFREDILPIILRALETATHGIVEATLNTLPFVLSALDFSTIKNELFPAIAHVFAKTSSLNIKIRGLEAFCILCGGKPGTDGSDNDGLGEFGGSNKKPTTLSSSAILDKFTIQEKIVPLLKGIKTKEPGVMMAALKVFCQVGEVADSDFLATEVLPVLWNLSLGPLLNLQQFQSFMALIKTVSNKIELEHTKKLQELSSSSGNGRSSAMGGNAYSSGSTSGWSGGETDFETLVSGRKHSDNGSDPMNEWGVPDAASSNFRSQPAPRVNETPSFSWQSSTANARPTQNSSTMAHIAQPMIGRAITPDLAAFATLTPNQSSSKPAQFNLSSGSTAMSMPLRPAQQTQVQASSNTGIDWSAAATATSSASAWSAQRIAQQPSSNGFGATTKNSNAFTISPPPTHGQGTIGSSSVPSMFQQQQQQQQQRQQQQQQQQPFQQGTTYNAQKTGLDKYESLI